MFQNLANYLLSSVTNQDQGATAEGVENSSIRLTSVEQDEWLLVDRDSEGNSDVSSVESLDLGDSNLPLQLHTRSSSTSSLPCTSNMEESWFITPPPCFTSAGPINMETSPLENLLIEHPSMSVYQHSHTRRYVAVAASIRSSSSHSEPENDLVDIDIEDIEDEVGEPVAVVITRNPRINRLQLSQELDKQNFKSKRAQKLQIQKTCQSMKRGYLNRNNKAREVNSRNRQQRRGERSQGATRSHANNNRKC